MAKASNTLDNCSTLPSLHPNHAPTPPFASVQLTYHHQEKHPHHQSAQLLTQGVPPKAPTQVSWAKRLHKEKERRKLYQAYAIVTSNNKILHPSPHL